MVSKPLHPARTLLASRSVTIMCQIWTCLVGSICQPCRPQSHGRCGPRVTTICLHSLHGSRHSICDGTEGVLQTSSIKSMNLCIQGHYYQPATALEAQDLAVETEGMHVAVTLHGVQLHTVA